MATLFKEEPIEHTPWLGRKPRTRAKAAAGVGVAAGAALYVASLLAGATHHELDEYKKAHARLTPASKSVAAEIAGNANRELRAAGFRTAVLSDAVALTLRKNRVDEDNLQNYRNAVTNSPPSQQVVNAARYAILSETALHPKARALLADVRTAGKPFSSEHAFLTGVEARRQPVPPLPRVQRQPPRQSRGRR